MATEINFTELEDTLIVSTASRYSLFEVCLSTVTAGTAAGFLASYFIGWLPAGVLAMIVALLAFLNATRVRTFELRVTSSDLVLVGAGGDNFGSFRRLSTADVKQIEYVEDTSGPETAYHPEGLYVRTKHLTIRMLPGVDALQTAEITARLEEKFPALSDRPAACESVFGSHFTALGLSE
jgi:hypothetical protein